MVKAAGMRYITITTKHHDGFAMFDSKVSDYDVVDKTPYGKDVLKQLADECRKQGVKLFFYHSQLDWHHPDYFPRGRTGRHLGPRRQGRLDAYLDYMDAQLKELLTGYGEIGGIWFDGWWDKPDADWRLGKTYGLIHQLQPAALVGANHHRSRSRARTSRCSRRTCRATTPRASTRSRSSASCLSRCATPSTTRGATTRTTAATRARSSSCTCW